MRKYSYARALAWALVGSGSLIAVISLVVGILGIASGLTLPHGVTSNIGTFAATQLVTGTLLGLVTALFGFLFHAVFDAAEAYVGRSSDG